jgi:predicted GNAT family N-acyltransferase
VTTIPQFRLKGIGTDMTLQVLFYAHDNFRRRIGVLTASKYGEPVYRKIGFQKLKDFYVFNIKEL